jgi:gamma-glutamylcyclotransferase (GGCT)/AIG2-like uncharacterized protein YtfP
LGEGSLQAKLYQLNGYPGAVPSTDPQDQTQGEIYALEDPGVLALLDAYEGGEYRREMLEVQRPGGLFQACWAYVYTGPLEGLAPVPGGRFLV